jgi:hypothetical protein
MRTPAPAHYFLRTCTYEQKHSYVRTTTAQQLRDSKILPFVSLRDSKHEPLRMHTYNTYLYTSTVLKYNAVYHVVITALDTLLTFYFGI